MAGFLAGVASSDQQVAELTGELDGARSQHAEEVAEFDARLAEATARRRDRARPAAAAAEVDVAEASDPEGNTGHAPARKPWPPGKHGAGTR